MKIKTTETKSVKTEVNTKDILEDYRKRNVEKLKKRGFKNIVSEFKNDILTTTYDK